MSEYEDACAIIKDGNAGVAEYMQAIITVARRSVALNTMLEARIREIEAVPGGIACQSPEQHMPETTTKGEQAD